MQGFQNRHQEMEMFSRQRLCKNIQLGP